DVPLRAGGDARRFRSEDQISAGHTMQPRRPRCVGGGNGAPKKHKNRLRDHHPSLGPGWSVRCERSHRPGHRAGGAPRHWMASLARLIPPDAVRLGGIFRQGQARWSAISIILTWVLLLSLLLLLTTGSLM